MGHDEGRAADGPEKQSGGRDPRLVGVPPTTPGRLSSTRAFSETRERSQSRHGQLPAVAAPRDPDAAAMFHRGHSSARGRGSRAAAAECLRDAIGAGPERPVEISARSHCSAAAISRDAAVGGESRPRRGAATWIFRGHRSPTPSRPRRRRDSPEEYQRRSRGVSAIRRRRIRVAAFPRFVGEGFASRRFRDSSEKDSRRGRGDSSPRDIRATGSPSAQARSSSRPRTGPRSWSCSSPRGGTWSRNYRRERRRRRDGASAWRGTSRRSGSAS